MKKFTRTGKKVLSVFLAALMVMTAWVFVAPEAKATSGGTYYVTVTIKVDNKRGGDNHFELTYKDQNGTTGTKKESSVATSTGTKTYKYALSGAPISIKYNNYGSSTDISQWYITSVVVSPNSNYTTGAITVWAGEFGVHNQHFMGSTVNSTLTFPKSFSGWNNSDGTKRKQETTSSFSEAGAPFAKTITMGGGSDTLTVPTKANGSVSSNAYTATVYDQYGVAWYKDATLSADYPGKITFSDNKITATNANSNASNNYDVTVTASYTGLTSKTKTCKIIVFDYNVTFKNHDGTVLSGPTSYDYNKTPAAPLTNPTRSPDANNHYTFNGWNPTRGALTTGAQDKVYTAQYKAEAHNFVWKTDKEPTCTATGLKHEQCTCGYKRSENTVISAKGHSFTVENTDSKYLKSAANCTDNAVYYYKCSRCDASSKGATNTTWTKTGTALGHQWGNWIIDKAATCTEGGTRHRVCGRNSSHVESGTYGPNGHNWESAWTTDKEATCTSKGSKSHHCTNCDAKKDVTEIPKKDHTPGAPASCETAQICTVCKTVLKGALGHDYSKTSTDSTHLASAATCTDSAVYYKSCSRCSKNGTETFTYGNPLGHDMGEWHEVKASECLAAGSKRRDCKRDKCTYFETQEIPAVGHNWGEWTISKNETCTAAGVDTRVCKRDSSHTETRPRPALGHNFASTFTVDKEQTCTETGIKSRHCSRCDATTDVTVIPANGHNYGEWITDDKATCTKAGTKHRICSVCQNREDGTIPALGHNWNTEWTVDLKQSCTAVGSKSHHCTRCNEKKDITEIPMDPHTFEWKIDREPLCWRVGLKHEECSACGFKRSEGTEIPTIDHTESDWIITVEPTCTGKGHKVIKCTVAECGKILREDDVAPKGHTGGEWIIDKNPSCTETGKKHQICAVCKETIKEETIGQTPHTLVHEHQNATCTEDGYDRDRCSVCNGVFNDKVLKKLGHISYVESDTQPSCYYDGLYKVVCSREGCGAILETEVRPALGHIYDKGTRYPANCTMGEYIEYVCTRSGCTEDEPGHKMTEVFSNLEALGHDWSAWTPVKGKEPTCTNVGEEERSCQREGCTAHETRPLSKLGHNMEAGEKVAASCISGAYTPYTCQNNGCTFSYNVYDETQPATDHTWVTTTSQEGNVLTVTCECSVCHKTHTKQVEVDEVHNYSVVSEIKPATCKEAGKIRITCDGTHKAGCTEYIEVETPVNANAHSYETTRADATCKQEGYVLSKCSICGNEIKTTLPTTAHAWDKGVETKPATCTETGIKTFTCSICGDTYTEVIAQKQHKFELINTVAPTCKNGGKSGYKVYKCSTCTATYNEITDDAISHNWSDWTVVQKATDKLCGIEESTCSVCGEKQLRTTDPIGDHNFVEDIATKKAATCTEDGSVTMKCTAHTDCGVTYEKVLPKLGHDMKAGEPVAATCEHEGYTDYTCARCDHSYRIVTEAKKAHTLEIKTEAASSCLDPSVTYTYCTKCNKLMGEVTVGQALGHEFTVEVSYKAPTNSKNGEKVLKCSRCTETITVVIPAQGHEFELVSTKDATCSETGLETYRCKTHTGDNDCGLSYTNVIPMKAHTYATRVKTPANCVNAGVGEYYCSVCNEVFGEYDIAALGHNFTEEKENVASTCNTVGYVTKKCSRCDETETTYSSTLAGHSWGELKVVQTADETHPGIKVKQCSVCKLYEYEYTAPTGNHKWNEGVVTTPATCTTEGVKTYTCVADGTCACKADKKATYTETIPATGHTAKVDVKEATCTEAGYVKAVCENENCPLSGRVIDEKVLPKKDHVEKVTVVEATCTTPGSKIYTCAVCGVTTKPTEEIPVVPHAYEATGKYVEATCTSPKYEKYNCKYCGEEKLVKVDEANGHTVDESKTKTVPATCTTAGSVSKYCSCGQLMSVEVINPSAHTWKTVTVKLPKECNGSKVTYEKCSVCGVIKADSLNITENGDHEYVVDTKTAATCTTPGILVITCKNCENINVEVEVPAVGHTYDDGVLTEGTCKTDGNVTFTCTREGCTDAQTGHTITKNIGKKNHNYIAEGVPNPATCISSGYQLYKCEYCGEEFKEILEAPASHVYEKQSTSIEPNCYKSGHYIFKCKNCAATYEYDLPATGNHKIKSEVTQEQSCTNPEITTYTCTTDGCGYSYIKVTKSALGHSWSDWKVTKEPNEETGENGEQVRSCTRSGCDATETAPIPAKIHNWGETPIAKTDASCTEAATETYQCIGCDICNAETGFATYVKTVGVPLQHMVVVNYTAATCTNPGSYVARCTLCEKEFVNETISATGHSFNTYLQNTYVPATCQEEGSVTYACSNSGCSETQVQKLPVNPNAHNMVEDPDNSKEATCTKAGYKAYKCANRGCDHKYLMQVENPVPHTERTVTIAATCTEKGSTTVVCSVCKTILKETEYTPALGHRWGEWKVTVPGTCAVEGQRTRECSVCHETETISTGIGEHVYPAEGVVTPATCTADGFTTYTCTVCNKHSVIRDYTAKLGHKYSADYKIIIQPTCHSTGAKAHYCVRCGAFEAEHDHSYVPLPKLAHTYGEWVVTAEPTCDTNGVKTRTCTGCTDKDEGHTQTELIGKIGHNYGEWEITKKATCVEEGSQRRYCDRCKTWEVQATPKGGHNRVADYAVEATCTAPGKTAGSHCSICGYVFVAQQEVPMKEHMDLNGDGRCEGCGKTMYSPNGETDSCLCHGTGFRAFIYKIVLIIWKIFKINKNCVCGAKHY